MIAIDLLEMDAVEGVDSRNMDFHDAEAPARLREWLGGPADGVLSDMAANATGHRKTDQLRIIGLVELAADFACGSCELWGPESDLARLKMSTLRPTGHLQEPASPSRAAGAENFGFDPFPGS